MGTAVVRVKLPCLWGKPRKRVFLDVSENCSCRFAWQAWHFVTFDVFQEECVCATVVGLKLPCLWGKPRKRVFLDVSECAHVVLRSRRGTLQSTVHSTLYTPHSLHTPHSPLHSTADALG